MHLSPWKIEGKYLARIPRPVFLRDHRMGTHEVSRSKPQMTPNVLTGVLCCERSYPRTGTGSKAAAELFAN